MVCIDISLNSLPKSDEVRVLFMLVDCVMLGMLQVVVQSLACIPA